MFTIGEFARLGDISVNDVLVWVEQNGYLHVGPGRDFFLDVNVDDPEKQVFEIQMPVRRPEDAVPVVAPQRTRQTSAAGRKSSS